MQEKLENTWIEGQVLQVVNYNMYPVMEIQAEFREVRKAVKNKTRLPFLIEETYSVGKAT